MTLILFGIRQRAGPARSQLRSRSPATSPYSTGPSAGDVLVEFPHPGGLVIVAVFAD